MVLRNHRQRHECDTVTPHAMEDARGQKEVVQAAFRSLWKTKEAVDEACWALKKVCPNERQVFSHWQLIHK